MPPKPSREIPALLRLLNQEGRTYLCRLRDMAGGLKFPHDTIEYKEARRELERLWAPVVAVLIPVAILIALCVTTFRPRPAVPVAIQTILAEEVTVEPLEEIAPPAERTENLAENNLDEVLHTEISSTAFGDPVKDMDNAANPALLTTLSPVTFRGVPSRGGGGGGLGGGKGLRGDLRGTFISLSRDAKGNPRKARLLDDVRQMLSKGFKRSAFTSYLAITRPVYMSYLMLPYAKSSLGPTTFHAERTTRRGSPWVIVYRGTLRPQESGAYRFAGLYDDVMVIRVNGTTVFEFAWDTRTLRVGEQTALRTGWTPKDADATGAYTLKGYGGAPLTFGDWFTLDAAKPTPIEILIGDNGGNTSDDGGFTGGLLLVEQQGHPIAKAPDGFPLLPPFAASPLSFAEHSRLAQLQDPTNTHADLLPFSLENIPVMSSDGRPSLPTLTSDDLRVNHGTL